MTSAKSGSFQFQHSWRAYQARVLQSINAHLSDDKLHIVAAPGAGKTLLGLEVIGRLQGPTLILAPTLVIQRQWRDRLLAHFDTNLDPNQDISLDISQPAWLTIATYQALFSLVRKMQLKVLSAGPHAPQCLALDECHHLRREWWQALRSLRNQLPQAKILALTATPPFDVSAQEWNRYHDLCGPIDEDVSIPELVKAGDLCPHQDFVYLCGLDESTNATLAAAANRRQEWHMALLQQRELQLAILSHPWLSRPEHHAQAIAQQPALFLSMWRYLTALGLPGPALDREQTWLTTPGEFSLSDGQNLLSDLLTGDPAPYGWHTQDQNRWLKNLGLLPYVNNGKLSLQLPTTLRRQLALQASKVAACVEIFRQEQASQGEALRLAVLTNYIRQGALQDPSLPTKLGAVPIFRAIAKAHPDCQHLGLLTGSIIILPRPLLAELAGRDLVQTPVPVPGLADYDYARPTASQRASCVAAVTTLLDAGRIRCLVGTAALLGEGWDAPCVNRLILASPVSTYVQLNQMRGRAIRTDPQQPAKQANIWHLAAVSPHQTDGGPDYQRVQRVLHSFPGLHFSEARIESGQERLPWPADFQDETLSNHNRTMFAAAESQRFDRAAWQAAFLACAQPEQGRLQERLLGPKRTPSLDLPRTAGVPPGAVASIGTLGGAFAAGASLGFAPTTTFFLALASAAGVYLWQGGEIGGWTLAGHRNDLLDERSLNGLGAVIRGSLQQHPKLRGDWGQAKIRWQLNQSGVAIDVSGVGPYERDVMLSCLSEFLGHHDNPRYILVSSRQRLYAVPKAFESRKDLAQIFHHAWQARFGAAELIYAKTLAGQKLAVRLHLQQALNLAEPWRRQSVWTS